MVCQRVVAAQHPDRLALSADPLCFCVARWGRRPSRTWRAVTVALADGEAVELAAPVALGPRDRARLAATKQTAKDTAGTTAVGRHPPKFREPSNKRILTRAKCNYAKPGEEIELIFEDGGFNATKSQALPVARSASSKPKINSSTCCARPGRKVGTLMRPETNLTISRRVSSPKCRATAISQKAISTGRCLAYSIKNALR